MKYKVITALIIVAALLFGSGITYSIFHSSATAEVNKNIAKFVFNAEKTDHIELSLVDLKPGTKEDYTFSVTNTDNNVTSNVLIEYQITIKSLHLIPLSLDLYKNNDLTTPIMTCDERNTREDNGELVCNSDYQNLQLDNIENDNYVLQVKFPTEYNDEKYSNLVDYIDLSISSSQKIKTNEE